MTGETFGIEKEHLDKLLREVHDGELQLPDFQRGWVWPWESIAELIASISLGYPTGTLMMLQAAGKVRFKTRPVEGTKAPVSEPRRLILDGQQRLTSLYQALQQQHQPVHTQDSRKRKASGWFYMDMEHAVNDPGDRGNAVVFVSEDRVRRNFGANQQLDLSDRELEYRNRMFPCNQLFNPNKWFTDCLLEHPDDAEFRELWTRFETEVLVRFQKYNMPVIELDRDTSREAVCQVFERVNTGGVTLTVFELLTATYAADEFELRTDWEQRQQEWDDSKYSVLREVSETDFLQAVTLLASYRRHQSDQDIRNRANCRRSDILALTLDEYRTHAPEVVSGLLRAAKFLHEQNLFDSKFLPYGSQLIPLSAIFAVLDSEADTIGALDKISRWYWCGVFGELYGGSTETRFAADLPEVVDWVRGSATEPRTVAEAQFFASRLWSMRTRNSAAYKGLYALLLRNGATDWASGNAMSSDTYFEEAVDIHHIFPGTWCEQQGIKPNDYNSILNKTALSARTNRIIGGAAPSKYLIRLARQAQADTTRIDHSVSSHLIDAELLRSDNYDKTIRKREEALLELIGSSMGKPAQNDIVRE